MVWRIGGWIVMIKIIDLTPDKVKAPADTRCQEANLSRLDVKHASHWMTEVHP